MLYSPAIGGALLNYIAAEKQATCLDAQTREVVILTVRAVFRSEYERYSHNQRLRKQAYPTQILLRWAEGRGPGPDSQLRDAERLAQRVVQALCVDRRVAPDLYEQAVKTWT